VLVDGGSAVGLAPGPSDGHHAVADVDVPAAQVGPAGRGRVEGEGEDGVLRAASLDPDDDGAPGAHQGRGLVGKHDDRAGGAGHQPGGGGAQQQPGEAARAPAAEHQQLGSREVASRSGGGGVTRSVNGHGTAATRCSGAPRSPASSAAKCAARRALSEPSMPVTTGRAATSSSTFDSSRPARPDAPATVPARRR
jgi:hypothetical protein